MKDYQKEFLEFALAAGVLSFGEFTLKSGRKSPYFFNTGLFNSGERLRRLGRFYADTIVESERHFDVLYGPAYKGIPLVSTTVVALADRYHRDVPFSFNRKEVKDHGEGGAIVGADLKGDVAILDDVISAGTSVAESVAMIRGCGARPAAVFIALDRQERGRESAASAVQEVEQQYDTPVYAIAALETLVAYLKDNTEYGRHLDALKQYRDRYGAGNRD